MTRKTVTRKTVNRKTVNRKTVGCLSTREWRRLERSAVAAHDRQSLLAVRSLVGAVAVDVFAGTSLPGIVRIRGMERLAVLAGSLTAEAVPVSPASSPQGESRLLAAGRYGPFWWLRLRVAGRDVTVLGTHLLVVRLGDGGGRDGSLDSPAGGESILVSCDYGSPSATSPV